MGIIVIQNDHHDDDQDDDDHNDDHDLYIIGAVCMYDIQVSRHFPYSRDFVKGVLKQEKQQRYAIMT